MTQKYRHICDKKSQRDSPAVHTKQQVKVNHKQHAVNCASCAMYRAKIAASAASLTSLRV